MEYDTKDIATFFSLRLSYIVPHDDFALLFR